MGVAIDAGLGQAVSLANPAPMIAITWPDGLFLSPLYGDSSTPASVIQSPVTLVLCPRFENPRCIFSRGEPIMKITYSLYIALLLAIIGLTFPTLVLASDEDGCSHEPTVQALRDCLVHAADAGHIDNPGVTQSLLAKLNAAQDALDRGQKEAAVNKLQAFIQAVEAQDGTHILNGHAEHLVHHANEVITALSQ